jgi:hypothetical protein
MGWMVSKPTEMELNVYEAIWRTYSQISGITTSLFAAYICKFHFWCHCNILVREVKMFQIHNSALTHTFDAPISTALQQTSTQIRAIIPNFAPMRRGRAP